MSNNQLYPYEALNNNYNNNNNNNNNNYLKNQYNLIQGGNYIVSQTFTYQRKISRTYDNTTQNNKVKKYNNKNKKQHNTKQHNTNQHNTNKHNINKSISDKQNNKKKKKPQNNHKVDIKSPKNNNCNYIITNTKPNTEIISIHKDIYNEYHEDIHKLFDRVEFHLKNDNINSVSSYWTEILNKFNYIYNIYNGNKGIVDQYSMEKTFKELHDKMTSLTKK
jgi:hypothetical protein